MFMGLSGFGGAGFGDVWSSCARTALSVDGTAVECIDSNDNVIASTPTGQQVPPSTTGAASSSAQSSWWATALTALTKGYVQGTAPATSTLVPCVSPGVPAGCNYTPVVAEPPWYTTPIGIGGIVLTLGLGYFLLKK